MARRELGARDAWAVDYAQGTWSTPMRIEASTRRELESRSRRATGWGAAEQIATTDPGTYPVVAFDSSFP